MTTTLYRARNDVQLHRALHRYIAAEEHKSSMGIYPPFDDDDHLAAFKQAEREQLRAEALLFNLIENRVNNAAKGEPNT